MTRLIKYLGKKFERQDFGKQHIIEINSEFNKYFRTIEGKRIAWLLLLRRLNKEQLKKLRANEVAEHELLQNIQLKKEELVNYLLQHAFKLEEKHKTTDINAFSKKLPITSGETIEEIRSYHEGDGDHSLQIGRFERAADSYRKARNFEKMQAIHEQNAKLQQAVETGLFLHTKEKIREELGKNENAVALLMQGKFADLAKEFFKRKKYVFAGNLFLQEALKNEEICFSYYYLTDLDEEKKEETSANYKTSFRSYEYALREEKDKQKQIEECHEIIFLLRNMRKFSIEAENFEDAELAENRIKEYMALIKELSK